MRRLVVLLCACASGRPEPDVTDAAIADSSPARDAPGTDGPTSSGTCAQAFTGTLATWSFAGAAGNQASTAVTSNAAGITAGAITRSAGLTAVTGASSINSSNWGTTAQLDPTKYYAFTIAPPAGCTLSLTTAAIDAKASATGPVSGSIATSVDAYAQTAAVSTATAGSVALTVMNAPGMVELRIYGYAASATGGTMRLQTTLSVDGQLK